MEKMNRSAHCCVSDFRSLACYWLTNEDVTYTHLHTHMHAYRHAHKYEYTAQAIPPAGNAHLFSILFVVQSKHWPLKMFSPVILFQTSLAIPP